MQISRWYCPTGHTTFSLLPDCLASRLPGSLDEVEQVVAIVEAKVAAGESIEKAAEKIRPDIELPGPCAGCDGGWERCGWRCWPW